MPRNFITLQQRETIRREYIRLSSDPYFAPVPNPRLVQYFVRTYGINRSTIARLLKNQIYTRDK